MILSLLKFRGVCAKCVVRISFQAIWDNAVVNQNPEGHVPIPLCSNWRPASRILDQKVVHADHQPPKEFWRAAIQSFGDSLLFAGSAGNFVLLGPGQAHTERMRCTTEKQLETVTRG